MTVNEPAAANIGKEAGKHERETALGGHLDVVVGLSSVYHA